jgi:hypothetical protein
MEEARAVIRRLERIEALEREGAHPAALLAELHELVREAEVWARVEGDERAAAAAASLTGLAETRYAAASSFCR